MFELCYSDYDNDICTLKKYESVRKKKKEAHVLKAAGARKRQQKMANASHSILNIKKWCSGF